MCIRDRIATVEAATRQNVSPSTWGKVLESYLVGPTRMSIDLASEHDHQRVDLIYRSRLLYAELSGKQLASNDPSLVLDERTYKPDGFANLTKEEKKRILDEADRTEQMWKENISVSELVFQTYQFRAKAIVGKLTRPEYIASLDAALNAKSDLPDHHYGRYGIHGNKWLSLIHI